MRENGRSWAQEYELVTERDNWLYKDYGAVLRELADLVIEDTDTGSLIVQLGVGTANLTELLLEKRNVIGIEPSGEMARIARRRCPGLRVIGSELRDLPFQAAAVDLVVSAYIWHQLSPEDRVDSLGEVRRVLRPGGQVVVADVMFRDPASEHSLREQLEKAGLTSRLTLLDEESEEYPLLSELRIDFGRFGFSFSGKQRTELVWLFRAKLL